MTESVYSCGCCCRRGEAAFCACVFTVCRRCSYCLRHCRCVGPRCIGEELDELMERVLAATGPSEIDDPEGPFGWVGVEGPELPIDG